MLNSDNVIRGYMAAQYLINLNHEDIRLMVGEVNGSLLSHNVDRVTQLYQDFKDRLHCFF